MKPTTVHIFYRTLKSFFNWLVAENMLDSSPIKNIKPPKLPQTVVAPFSNEDIRRLLILTSGNSFLELRNRALVLLFLLWALYWPGF